MWGCGYPPYYYLFIVSSNRISLTHFFDSLRWLEIIISLDFLQTVVLIPLSL
jgi:hypothetical protein